MKVLNVSENTFIVYLGEHSSTMDLSVTLRINQAAQQIKHAFGAQLLDMIPSYQSIHLTFDILTTDFDQVVPTLEVLLAEVFIDEQNATSNISANSFDDLGYILEIPVYYDVEVADDLESVAQALQMTQKDIIALHSQPNYAVFAIGFAPGFAYLGELNSKLLLPRKKTPSTYVPEGSVAISENQTAVYPSDSPGGWHVIGRTPMKLVDRTLPDLTPFKVGMKVQFVPIDRETYLSIGGELS